MNILVGELLTRQRLTEHRRIERRADGVRCEGWGRALARLFPVCGPRRRRRIPSPGQTSWSKALVRHEADPQTALAAVLGVAAEDIQVRDNLS